VSVTESTSAVLGAAAGAGSRPVPDGDALGPPSSAALPGRAGSPPRRGLARSLLRNRKATLGVGILVLFATLALLAPVLAPGDPTAITDAGSRPPSGGHLLGTTAKGQDVLALTLWGARSSLFVGFIVGLAATLVGVTVGLAAAYFGKVTDDVLSLATNVFLLLPGLPLLVVLAAFLPPGTGTVIVVLVITGWAGAARVLRSLALSISAKDFVAAATVTGEGAGWIMFREILPNMASIVMSTLLGGVIFGIGSQAGLEFLGLGDVSVVSWGTNLYWASNDGALMVGAWWAFLPSGLCIALVAFGLALLNYAVDEVTNPRLRVPRRARSAARRLGSGTTVSGALATSVGRVAHDGGEVPVLEVCGLTVEYRGENRTVVGADRVSFTIGEGEVFGLAGESGCGKSTVAHAIMRLLREPAVITAGTVRFCGRDVVAMSDEELRAFRWRDVAMVFQSAMNSLNPVMTIGDQIVDIFTTHERVSRAEALRRAGDLLELVQIERSRLRSYPHQLSGGMRQRVVIAMAVALRPRLLIMDEPTTALDVVVQQEIMAQIADLRRELGFAVLFITHDMSLMIELSDRIGVMYAGRLVESAPAPSILTEPRHPYTRALIDAFPPLTGPRRELAGLADGVRFTDIGDLVEVAPEHWVAPHDEEVSA
jgi:ABC-type dipeptide/oligopeptide/nickel transport system ATPase component/ABC-type dipeptide/oligopeptide/nickel transport system permease subunit